MNKLFAILLVSCVATVANAAPTAVYDPATGNIKFDDFTGVSSVRLFSNSGALIPNVGNNLGFGFTEKTATLYSWLDFGAGVSGSGLDAGNIVTPNTAPSDLLFDYKIGLAGAITVGDIITTGPPIPEPATFVLAGISMLGLAAVRRRMA